MSLVYSDQSRWADSLWLSHLEKFPSARVLLQEGTRKQPAFPDFSTDVHSTLYLRHLPPSKDDAPTWATDLLTQAKDLPEFHQLKQRCMHNGFAAGMAAEKLLTTLLPLIPQEEEKPQPQKPDGAQRPQDGPGATEGHEGMPGGPGGPQPAPGDGSATRRALRQACREASQTIDDAETATDALGEALGRHQGHGPGSSESLQSLDEVRSLYALLQNNKELQHIAALAGRLVRLGDAHKKTIVTPAVGAIKGIEIGGILERLLPSELVGLRSPAKLLRLQTLDKILNKRALQYKMAGVESETRGPIIALIDESGSMTQDGKQAWSKACALALLTIATTQKRPCYLIGFNYHPTHEHHFVPEKVDMADLCAALMARCLGGTDFDSVLLRALQVFRQEPTLHKSDVVLISDGEASIDPEVTQAVLAMKQQHGLHVYGLLIGDDASGESLAPLADMLYHVSNTPERDNVKIAPLLAKVS